MARNTPFAQRVTRSTTDVLKSHTGDAGELYLDETKGTLTVTDGKTPGGISTAREDRKIISGTSALKINGGAEGTLASDLTLTLEGGVGGGNLAVDVPIDQVDEATLEQLGEGNFITAPIVGGVSGSGVSGDPLLSATTIYVGGSGAGDNLIDGRGLVPELPFERLSVAVEHTLKKNHSYRRDYIIQGDVEDDTIINLDSGYLNIKKAGNLQQKPKIVTNRIFLNIGRVGIYEIDIDTASNIAAANSGYLEISNCNVKSPSSCVWGVFGGELNVINCSLEVTDGSHAILAGICGTVVLSGSLVINGKFAYGAINSDRLSKILFEDTNVTVSGNVDGAKYYATNGSVIKLMGVSGDSLPGTLAGVCDSSSKII